MISESNNIVKFVRVTFHLAEWGRNVFLFMWLLMFWFSWCNHHVQETR